MSFWNKKKTEQILKKATTCPTTIDFWYLESIKNVHRKKHTKQTKIKQSDALVEK